MRYFRAKDEKGNDKIVDERGFAIKDITIIVNMCIPIMCRKK